METSSRKLHVLCTNEPPIVMWQLPSCLLLRATSLLSAYVNPLTKNKSSSFGLQSIEEHTSLWKDWIWMGTAFLRASPCNTYRLSSAKRACTACIQYQRPKGSNCDLNKKRYLETRKCLSCSAEECVFDCGCRTRLLFEFHIPNRIWMFDQLWN